MKTATLAVLATLPLCALAACAPKVDSKITAAQLPQIKAGLWQQTQSSDNGAPTTSKACQTADLPLPGAFIVDGCGPATPAPVGAEPSAPGDIHMSYVKYLPGTITQTAQGAIVIDAACSQGEMSTSLHTNASGDFDSRFVIDSKTTMGAKGVAPEAHTTHSEYQFVGPCPAH